MSYDADIFIDHCYGGESGIIYVDGVYGNFQPDVPRIYIESPTIYHTYLFGVEIPILIKQLPIQRGAPRLLGKNTLHVSATNTQTVEIYLDGDLQYSDEASMVSWEITAERDRSLRLQRQRCLHGHPGHLCLLSSLPSA
jgi:hypothetical protein